VPPWARFMSAVTRGDAPRWLDPPPGVVAADVCLVSGKLATSGCSTHRERYFAEGTEPIEYCDVHGPGLIRRVFGLVAGRAPQQIPHDDPAARPPVATAATVTPAPPAEIDGDAVPAAQVKKRGFWSRVLHPRRER